MDDCSECIYSSPAVMNGIDENEGEQIPVLKCYRYPAVLMMDSEDQVNQTWPEATHLCGEYAVEKTPPVIGTIRKVKDHATRISNRVIGHLHRGNRRNRSLQDSGPADQPQDGVGP